MFMLLMAVTTSGKECDLSVMRHLFHAWLLSMACADLSSRRANDTRAVIVQDAERPACAATSNFSRHRRHELHGHH